MYIVCYAKEYPENESLGRKFKRGLVRGVGAGIVGSGSLMIGGSLLAQKLMMGKFAVLNPQRLSKIRKAAETLYPGSRKVPIHRDSPFSLGFGTWVPKVVGNKSVGIKPGVHLPRNAAPEFLAHELGHSVTETRLKGKPLGTLRQKIRFLGGRMGANKGALYAPLVTQGVGHAAVEKSNLTPDQKRKAHIGMALVPAGFHAPILASEAGASVRALRILKKAGEPLAPASKRLGMAGGTYLVGATMGTPSSLGFASGFRRLRKPKEQSKES